MTPSRYIVTGAPGAGKTTVLEVLRARGHAVVGEAATDLIAADHARGIDESWRQDDFLEAIARLQVERQQAPTGAAVQLLDRSLVCTLALARHLDRPPPPFLAEAIEVALRDATYRPQVFFVRLLGFITPTAARRITYADSVRFERTHEETYRELGFELIDVPVAPIEERAELVEACLRRWERP
jgi:predicted ATPase